MAKKKELIGTTLKKYRQAIGLSVPQVAALMENQYHIKVAEKTIYGWESCQCNPPAKKFLALCDIYQIDTLDGEMLDFPAVKESKGFAIRPIERKLVEEYRRHPDMQAAVCRLLEIDEKLLKDLSQ